MKNLITPTLEGAVKPAMRIRTRWEYSDFEVFNPVLPGYAWHCFSVDGALDAPDWIPCGSAGTIPINRDHMGALKYL